MIVVILNSGATIDKRKQLASEITQAFRALEKEANVIVIKDNFARTCESLVKDAKATGNIIVAAGGDGTVNSVAAFCYRYGVALGIIPLGTFNYFARDLSIPIEILEAVKIITTGIS